MTTTAKYPEVRLAYREARDSYKERHGEKMSQESLALAVGTSRRHIIRIENGEHRPTVAMRDRIARVLTVDPESLPAVEDSHPFRVEAA